MSSISHEQCEPALLHPESNPVQRIVFHRFLTSLGVFDISVHREIQKEPCQTRLEAIVIRKFGKRKRVFPFISERDNTSSEHVFENLIDPFYLTTGMRVISGAKGEVGSHSILETYPKSRSKNTTTVRIDLQRN